MYIYNTYIYTRTYVYTHTHTHTNTHTHTHTHTHTYTGRQRRIYPYRAAPGSLDCLCMEWTGGLFFFVEESGRRRSRL